MISLPGGFMAKRQIELRKINSMCGRQLDEAPIEASDELREARKAKMSGFSEAQVDYILKLLRLAGKLRGPNNCLQ
jgi:hypothetical protein